MRSGSLYPSGGELAPEAGAGQKRKMLSAAGECCGWRPKRQAGGLDYLDGIPDDLVLSIFSKLAASASSPSDLLSVHLTCKRLNGLGRQYMVFAKASPASLAVKVASWSEPVQRFLECCADAGNLEACYILGMIRLYCLGGRSSGAALLAKAAVGRHPAALYSLAVIQFNGSGGARSDHGLRAGVALCTRSAALGHVDALRELGHCLQDGYGVRRDPAEGRRLLIAANGRELSLALAAAAAPSATHSLASLPLGAVCDGAGGCPLLSDFGWSLPEAEPHTANLFMSDWWALRGVQTTAKKPATGGELRLCSHMRCGRKETRRHEFRRCTVCGAANYCSRACQALDWKHAHKEQCIPTERWLVAADDGAAQ